ncbi:Pleckstrin y domain-containing family M member 2 [Phytophthora cinnamomi]|uniref:Pleckstrin y domain-containing family M member 2 n=1 Tax=Phytophthora cinnamomi TaxID=4785 RepID=UPI003559B384|nr:Pleckstrin y domain-containing family M member 2 [Phytophthora cinnamomi]
MEFFARLGNLVLGEPEEETEEQQQLRRRNRAKRQLQAKSHRGIILEDLESAVRGLQLFMDAKKGGGGSIPRRSSSMDDSTDSSAPPSDSNDSPKAAMMESTDDVRELLLNDGQAVVNLLCTQLDRCISHGLRLLETEDSGTGATVKFFGVVKWTCTRMEAIRQKQMVEAMHRAAAAAPRGATSSSNSKVCEVVTSSVEADLPRHVRGLVGAVRSANALTNVHTDEGKARAFIRQALNTHVLQSSLSMVLSETNIDLLASYYTEFALFRQRDEIKMFLNLLSGLDDLPFAFLIDDPRLDLAPETLPFSRPLPRPKARKIKKQAPKLIDPEDMVSGRVRLCEVDDETELLAEKLVSHHELRLAFNTRKGGNPLSETLKQAAQSQKMEDAATAVLRFLELGYPEYDVFGSDLLDVLCNPFLSGMARFETALGLPDVVEACFCYLYEHVDSPGLFQAHLQADHVMELRDTIEELGGFHRKMAVDPHEVVAILLQYLWELPDPLLTEERLDREQERVLHDFRSELCSRRSKLREKVRRLETLRFRMEEPLDMTNETHVALLKRLWDALLVPEDSMVEEGDSTLSASSNSESEVGGIDVSAMLASPRWKCSGFHTDNPLGGFRGGGVLALECLVFFVEEYPEKAHAMMERNAVAGGNRYPFPVASINVMRMMMHLLMLDEAPDVCTKLVLHSVETNGDTSPAVVLKLRVAERVSRTPFWRVFDDPKAFFMLHSMAFMLLDLHWVHSGATQMGFQPVLDATRRQMGWLLEQAPISVEEMWTTWMKVRELDATKFTGPTGFNSSSAASPTSSSMSSALENEQVAQQMARSVAAKLEDEPEQPQGATAPPTPAAG